MLCRAILPALACVALVQGAALAQSSDHSANSGQLAPEVDDAVQALPQQIRDRLASLGFKDVKVVPQSFLISATDSKGQPVMMLIGPDSMTVMTAPADDDEDTAQSKDDMDKPTKE